ncbi:hypothetical protein M430DRAFT_114495 [Amorphotheca resinae ATCC 22711]|uniref:Synaptobrevin n=1 Tax=Amorphotheca resinae ATCC 22711 TaxID=857342 RepID=A0A2T3B9T6_AMORE|nr:hypothetical protein M430DRAFT_114495 [Amorphotheca resinae ATCC 22711]PSS25087.1 hypothetical protein M430DRAFT_114495 [Amorphotheca resinae ATCC 22711]
MVRHPRVGGLPPDTTAIDLSRMLARLENILVTPDSATETKLRASSYEREKVGTNLEYARSLLLRLEQDALRIKIQSKKQEAQADLVRRRETLQMLSERLRELNELGAHQLEDDESSEGEDILGEETPSDETETDDQDSQSDAPPPTTTATQDIPRTRDPEPISTTPTAPITQPEPTSNLRSRNRQAEKEKAELLSGTSTGLSTATTEALLTHNRTEQESLTNSLLNMAQALKASSHSFASSLEEEKDILNRATEGLDKNELGLEAAQRRMGFLRKYTEGKGWWGRMMMYVWIAGLMVIALIIVFVLPKVRF